MSAQGYSGQNTPGITGGPGRGCLCPAGRGLRCRCVGLRGQAPFRLRRGYLPGAFCALPGGALLLSKVYFFTLRDRVPDPFIASGGAPFLPAERGERPPKGRIPFGNPYGQTNSGLRLCGTKRQSRLRNRSLVVPDKVPPADLYVESEPSFDAWLQLAHKHKKSKHSLGVPLVRPLEQSIQHMAEGAPKGGTPLWIPPRANAQRLAAARDQRTVPLAQPLFGCPSRVPPADF